MNTCCRDCATRSASTASSPCSIPRDWATSALTGDTLGDKASPIEYPIAKLPEPAITFAIEPKSRADEDKLGNGIHKLMEEDPMLRFFRDPQTKEFLRAGTRSRPADTASSAIARSRWTRCRAVRTLNS